MFNIGVKLLFNFVITFLQIWTEMRNNKLNTISKCRCCFLVLLLCSMVIVYAKSISKPIIQNLSKVGNVSGSNSIPKTRQDVTVVWGSTSDPLIIHVLDLLNSEPMFSFHDSRLEAETSPIVESFRTESPGIYIHYQCVCVCGYASMGFWAAITHVICGGYMNEHRSHTHTHAECLLLVAFPARRSVFVRCARSSAAVAQRLYTNTQICNNLITYVY